jgi:hypothetical protein
MALNGTKNFCLKTSFFKDFLFFVRFRTVRIVLKRPEPVLEPKGAAWNHLIARKAKLRHGGAGAASSFNDPQGTFIILADPEPLQDAALYSI